MNVLVIGGSGATGKLLLRQLLDRGCSVTAIVRSPAAMPGALRDHPSLTLIQASVLELPAAELTELARGCSAVASCLGHTLSWTGVFAPPRRLVTEATRRLCAAITATEPAVPVRLVLMSSAGIRNRDLQEPVSLAQKAVIAMLRWLLPPHADNEEAAELLLNAIGQHHPSIRWVVVRPDNLIDADTLCPHALHPSPTRSAIFDAGCTSRLQVAHVMAELITDEALWATWAGRMPVIYDSSTDP